MAPKVDPSGTYSGFHRYRSPGIKPPLPSGEGGKPRHRIPANRGAKEIAQPAAPLRYAHDTTPPEPVSPPTPAGVTLPFGSPFHPP